MQTDLEAQITNKERIRSLIETFYDLQKLRIATGNRMYQTTLKNLSNTADDTDDDKATAELFENICKRV